MNNERILVFILAVALLLSIINNLMNNNRHSEPIPNPSTSGEKIKPTDSGEIIMQNILSRRSVREYTNQTVAPELLEKLVRAGMAAPTARNLQPWKFIILNQPEVMQKIAAQLPYAKMLANAPAAIVVCGDLDKAMKEQPGQGYWIQDCSAATENILLAAHGLGLGAVWTGGYPAEERANAVAKALNLPKNLVVLNVIVIGYPKSAGHPKDKWKPENLIWNGYPAAERQ